MDETQVGFLLNVVNEELDDELSETLLMPDGEDKIIAQYDALIDAMYFIADMAAKQGFNLDECFKEVHAANMRKAPGGKIIKNEIGKVQKPEGWYGPEESMRTLIQGHMERGSWKKED